MHSSILLKKNTSDLNIVFCSPWLISSPLLVGGFNHLETYENQLGFINVQETIWQYKMFQIYGTI